MEVVPLLQISSGNIPVRDKLNLKNETGLGTMGRWTAEEFDRVAPRTQLAPRTLDACRDVLVNGEKAVDAAKRHNVQAPHISRSIRRLEELQEKLLEEGRMQKVVDGNITVAEVLYSAAREAAQGIRGEGWPIRDAAAGHIYEGAGVVKVGGFFVQDIGRVGVIHDLTALEKEPVVGKRFSIRYPADLAQEAKATVEEIALDRGTREIER